MASVQKTSRGDDGAGRLRWLKTSRERNRGVRGGRVGEGGEAALLFLFCLPLSQVGWGWQGWDTGSQAHQRLAATPGGHRENTAIDTIKS